MKIIKWIFCLFPIFALAKDIDLSERGIVGDGKHDNWELIQRAIDEVAIDGGGTVYFPAGDFAIYDKSLVIWGENITLMGHHSGESSIIKKGKAGYFGDCIDLCGKIKNYKYYGAFGGGDYSTNAVYEGDTEPASHIVLERLQLISDLDSTEERNANNLGIINAREVQVQDCVFSSAPQTNVAIVNDTQQFYNENIQFVNCVFQDSHQHNVRVSAYNKGKWVGNTVSFTNCVFKNVLREDVLQKEVKNQKLHLWYRGVESETPEVIALQLEQCYFDDTGLLFLNGANTNLVIKNSYVGGALNIQVNTRVGIPKIEIDHTLFMKKGDFRAYFEEKTVLNQTQKLKNPYTETFFGSVYPATLLEHIKINALD